MLDPRLNTFVALCRLGSYTKTAQALFITQPAVTQQIKYLENAYGVELVQYKNKRLQITAAGQKLYRFVTTLQSDIDKLIRLLPDERECLPVRFGATRTIGDFIMPDILSKLLQSDPQSRLSMTVENTEVLLQMLEAGTIDFALLEGPFDQSDYGGEAFLEAEFIGICAAGSRFASGSHLLEELTGERLLLREHGSGSRLIFEQCLGEHNMRIRDFPKICEIGSLHGILELVAQGHGITFCYRAAAHSAVRAGRIKELSLEGFPVRRQLRAAWLKNSIFSDSYHAFLHRCRDSLSG